MSEILVELVDDQPLLLAVCEQLVPSMNGTAMRRLSFLFDELADGNGEQIDETDAVWLTDALSQSVPNRDRWANELTRLSDTGVELVTRTDARYPVNLKLVHDSPPVLFVQGHLQAEDRRVAAVVGTRTASQAGLDLARNIAEGLVAHGYTVVSGLAKGIDTAAHAATLNAGGRTVAVFGTPINKIYPAENRALAQRITRHGACVSQFLPGVDTERWGFPARNLTTSGLALGTVVGVGF